MGKTRIAALIVVLGLLAGAYWVWQKYFPVEEQVLQATGTIEATSVELTAKLAGSIEDLTINAGDTVKKGQLIAQLSRNDLVAQRERDELSVVKAEASLADLQSGARNQEIKEAEANVNIAQDNLKRASDDLARIKALFEAGAINQAEYEKAQTDREISANQLEAAKSRLSLVQAGNRQEVINAAQVEIERNKAILKATDAMLADLKIYAPIDGVVLSKNYEPGEYVGAGASIATVVNMDDLWIKVYIPTDDLPQVILGQQVTFTVSGLSRSFTGTVEEIATQGEFTPKTIQTKKERTNVVFAVKIRISSEGGVLKPGMPADVVFPGGGQDD
ncbi:HlyD family secretion protein [Candidatus Formimonas warabiya]|uniref:Secretion protein HlyD n=1 Tax=Formimonas warabiya TaxID=1761012 RepID=A0A3G1KUT7_FORW1|nr:HlyD family efflux transporter periplasmic adaptor subunit [Candidatus Formimonas warabiya]ATW26273.1 secretion protein HlyD [Candidatus Formimonas warabiya]